MVKQALISLGILLAFGCADVPQDKQFEAGCSEVADSVSENKYISPSSPDTTAPTISSPPTSGATDVSVSAEITVPFSEEMDSSTINSTNITVVDSSSNIVSGVWTYAGTTATFNPTNDLDYGTTYTVTVGTGVKDRAGNNLASRVNWSFKTKFKTYDGTTWVAATKSASFGSRQGPPTVSFKDKLWLGGGKKNDLWVSDNGTDWTLAQVNTIYPERTAHALIVFKNKMWILGGKNSVTGKLYDVWSSENGEDWNLVTSEFPGASRGQVIVSNNKIWIISYNIWSSSDGETWNKVAAEVSFMKERRTFALTSYQNRIWLFGGYKGSNMNDVWSTADGANWVRATAHAGFSVRNGLQSITYNNKMWVIGGTGSSFETNDVWSSVDGTEWVSVIEHAQFPKRAFFTALTHRNRIYVIAGWPGINQRDVWFTD